MKQEPNGNMDRPSEALGLEVAILLIDGSLGHEYARKNPALLGVLLQALSTDRLASAVEKVAEAIRGLR